ncbi:unnamed protein product [Cochlearia groenlandica]
MSTNGQVSYLDKLPQDILGDIIARVDRFSRTTVRHIMDVSTGLAKATDDRNVYKNMNLKPLTINPMQVRNKYT